MRINDIIMQQRALRIETHHLASRSESGVDAHHPLLPQRRSQQQLAEIFGKHTDGFLVGTFLAGCRKLGLDSGLEQTLVGIAYRLCHLSGTSPRAPHIPTL